MTIQPSPATTGKVLMRSMVTPFRKNSMATCTYVCHTFTSALALDPTNWADLPTGFSCFLKLFPPPAKPGQITLSDTYHGKVIPLQTARELVSVKENVCVGDLEKVIPYQLARAIVLDHPDHIVALDCPCRVARENPCLPLDVCLIVGEPFASFTLEHHPVARHYQRGSRGDP